MATGGFLPSDSDESALESSPEEIISLAESSKTLKVLLDFVYPRRQPNLLDVEFELLANVAEAAEKYEVYAAMNHCQMCMQ